MDTSLAQAEQNTCGDVNGVVSESPPRYGNDVVEKKKDSCQVFGETASCPPKEENKTNGEHQIPENGVCSDLETTSDDSEVSNDSEVYNGSEDSSDSEDSNDSNFSNDCDDESDTISQPVSRATINDLPDEIIVKIFSYLTFGELLEVAQKVSTRWKLLTQDKDLWHNKVYVISWCNTNTNTRRSDKTDEEAIYTLTNVPELRTVLMQRGVRSNVFRALYTNCRNLTSLQIGAGQKLSYSVMKNLVEKCSKIQILRMSNYLLQLPKFVDCVAELKHLRVLSLEEYSTNETHHDLLQPLADGCPQLAEIDLGHMYYSMEDLKYFLTVKHDKLKYLGIRWTMEKKRCVAPLLPICAESLERLELYQYDVIRDEAREAFIALGKLTNLRELTSMNLTAPLVGIVPLAFKNGGLSKLRLLDLWDGLGVEDEAVIAICKGCPLLRELRLRNALRVTDAGFALIYQLKYLQILDVSTCQGLGSDLMPQVARLPNLGALLMEELEFAKMLPGLMSILDITTLRCLNVNSSNISAIPFDQFPTRLVNLRELHVENCEGDRRIIEDLHTKMPQLQICGWVTEVISIFSESDLTDDDSDAEDDHHHHHDHQHVGHGAVGQGAVGHGAYDNSESYCEGESSSEEEDLDVDALFPEHPMLG